MQKTLFLLLLTIMLVLFAMESLAESSSEDNDTVEYREITVGDTTILVSEDDEAARLSRIAPAAGPGVDDGPLFVGPRMRSDFSHEAWETTDYE